MSISCLCTSRFLGPSTLTRSVPQSASKLGFKTLVIGALATSAIMVEGRNVLSRTASKLKKDPSAYAKFQKMATIHEKLVAELAVSQNVETKNLIPQSIIDGYKSLLEKFTSLRGTKSIPNEKRSLIMKRYAATIDGIQKGLADKGPNEEPNVRRIYAALNEVKTFCEDEMKLFNDGHDTMVRFHDEKERKYAYLLADMPSNESFDIRIYLSDIQQGRIFAKENGNHYTAFDNCLNDKIKIYGSTFSMLPGQPSLSKGSSSRDEL